MKIRKLDSRGFSHDMVAVLVVVLFAVVGTGYLVASHAATPTGHVTSELTSGGASLCLNVPGQGNVNFGAIDSAVCNSSVNTQNWQAKATKQTTVSGQTVQAYALVYNGGKYCAGVNGVNGVLGPVKSGSVTLEPKVELFGCRANQASFDSSYQQWAVVGGMLENINPNAVYNGSRMCMTATGAAASVELIACTNQAGQKWTLPTTKGGTNPTPTKPTTPTSVTATAKSATSVLVSWHASTDAGGPGLAGYAVFRNSKELSTVVNPATLSYTDSTAAAGTSYSYTVEAYDTATPANFSAPSAAATVTTPTAPGSGGSPTPTPTSSVSCNYQTDTWSGDASKVGYSVTKVSSKDGNPASFSVKLNASKGTTEVVGYPSDQCLLYSAMPSALTSSFNDTPPTSSSGLDYEFAYDIWLTTATAAKANNWNNDLELMIWNFVNGQVPAGSVKGSLSDGSKVWVAGSNTDGTVSVVLPKNETSGSVNIASIVSQLESAGYVTKSDNGILDVEYGIEAPYGGGQTFTVNSLSVAE